MLDHKQIGPYTILEKVDLRTYKLDLPATIKIHPVFHISLLEHTASIEPIPRHNQPPLPPIVIQEQQDWEVEKVLDSRRHRNQIQYRVKWTGFYNPDCTSGKKKYAFRVSGYTRRSRHSGRNLANRDAVYHSTVRPDATRHGTVCSDAPRPGTVL